MCALRDEQVDGEFLDGVIWIWGIGSDDLDFRDRYEIVHSGDADVWSEEFDAGARHLPKMQKKGSTGVVRRALSGGSRAEVRKGRGSTPEDPLAVKFAKMTGISHPIGSSEAEIKAQKRRLGRALAQAWRALQDNPDYSVIWSHDHDTSSLDERDLELLRKGAIENLQLLILDNRDDSVAGSMGSITIPTDDAKAYNDTKQLFEAEMALEESIGEYGEEAP